MNAHASPSAQTLLPAFTSRQWTDAAIAAIAVTRLVAAAASGGAVNSVLSATALDLVSAAGGVLCAVAWVRQPRDAWKAAVRRAVLPRQVGPPRGPRHSVHVGGRAARFGARADCM